MRRNEKYEKYGSSGGLVVFRTLKECGGEGEKKAGRAEIALLCARSWMSSPWKRWSVFVAKLQERCRGVASLTLCFVDGINNHGDVE